MRTFIKISAGILSASVALTISAPPTLAQDSSLVITARGGGNGKPGGGGGGSPPSPTYYSWMSDEIQQAWDQGFLGQDTAITVVDDFSSRAKLFGNLGDGLSRKRHGEWTLKQANLIAPSASMVADDFNSGDNVALVDGKFNVISLSYGWLEQPGLFNGLGAQETSIINHANFGLAFISKSAGNESIAVGDMISSGTYAGYNDYLADGLIGANSAVFVGALNDNGTVTEKASLASYSNFAGDNVIVQNQFLVVGVADNLTGLAGTSFAAPIISGYGAVLSNKFGSATADATEVANRLLDTARQDTIMGYSASLHGRGEASIARAIAPDAVN